MGIPALGRSGLWLGLALLACLGGASLVSAQNRPRYESVLRFECKMAIQYEASVQRFVFDDAEKNIKYFTACTFENYMWHHVMVSRTEDGEAVMYVDGQPQKLVHARNVNNLNVGFDERDDPDSTTFRLSVHPNKYVAGVESRRRSLLQAPTAAPTTTGSPTVSPTTASPTTVSPTASPTVTVPAPTATPTDSPTGAPSMSPTTSPTLPLPPPAPTQDARLDGIRGNMGFVESLEDSDEFVAGPATSTFGDHCSFRIGMRCPDWSSYGFEGLIDEVAVWNRALPASIINTVMFTMPGYMPVRKLEAPRGVSEDYTLGRVLYARFPNPCLQAPLQNPPPPPPQAPDCQIEGGCRRRQLLQMADTNQVQVGFTADMAGWMGGTSVNGTIDTVDLDNDFVGFVDFPTSTKYAYGGVPWLPPFVLDVEVDSNFRTQEGELTKVVPLDGGVQITLSGVGFAKSPWLKCAAVQPDPAGHFAADAEPILGSVGGPHYLLNGQIYPTGGNATGDGRYYSNTSWMDRPGALYVSVDTSFSMDHNAQVTYSDAEVFYANYSGSQRIHWAYSRNWTDDPNTDPAATDEEKLDYMRNNEIHPFGMNPFAPAPKDFVYGYWEKIVCGAPAAAFPSDQYYLGASNDGGVTGSPPFTATYQEFAAHVTTDDYNGTLLSSDLGTAMGSVFTIMGWFYPEYDEAAATSPEANAKPNLINMGHNLPSSQYSGAALYGSKFYMVGNGEFTELEGEYSYVEPNMWHHVAVKAVSLETGNAIAWYLDGKLVNEKTNFLPFDGGPSSIEIGKTFKGMFDEVKVFKYAMDEAQVDLRMKTREYLSNDNNALAYYRFNENPPRSAFGDYSVQLDEPTNAGRAVNIVPSTAPWEPTIVYEVNGNPIDPSNPYSNLVKSTYAGGETLTVSGFNFAKSPLMKCTWGPKPDTIDGVQLDISDPAGFTCPAGPAEGSLGRHDGLKPAMVPYAHYLTKPTYHAEPLEMNATYLKCVTPTVETAEYTTFTVGGGTTYNTLPFEFTDRALHCNGDGYVQADTVTEFMDVTDSGYTVSLWVYPLAQEPGAQKLYQSPRIRGSKHYPTTVLAFEGANGTNDALIMYDGHRFLYYDDLILDATTFTKEGSAPNEWHLVTVKVFDGEGDLYVDGKPQEHFTTKSLPAASSKLSLCQDYGTDGLPGSFFRGRVDSVRFYTDGLMDINPATHVTMTWSEAGIWALFEFRDEVVPEGTSGPSDFGVVLNPVTRGEAEGINVALVPTTAPWVQPTVIHVDPPSGDATAGVPLNIYATNVEWSKWFKLYIGDNVYTPADLEPIEGTVEDMVGMTLKSPPVDICQTVDVHASNDGVHNGTAAQHTYAATNVDLTRGLIGYWSMDLVDRTAGDGEATFYDHVGGNHFRYPAAYNATDRDGFVNRALAFGSAFEDGTIKLPNKVLPTATGEATVSVWVNLDADYLSVLYHAAVAAEKDDAGGLFQSTSEALATIVGGWRLLSMVITPEMDEPVLYVNEEALKSDSPAYPVLFDIWDLFNNESVLSCGPYDDLACEVDTLYVYDRALKPCEVAARYRTQTFALDMRQQPEGIAVSLPYNKTFSQMTVEAWVWPFSAAGFGSILKVDDTLELAVAGDRVSFGAYVGCECDRNAPRGCQAWAEWGSFKSKVVPGQWTHIAATFDGAKIMFFVDGTATDVYITDFDYFPWTRFSLDDNGFPQYPKKESLGWGPYNLDQADPRRIDKNLPSGASSGNGIWNFPSSWEEQEVPGYNLAGKQARIGAGFDGLVYDVRITPALIAPFTDLWDFTVCPRKEELAISTYFQLNEGTPGLAAAEHIHPPATFMPTVSGATPAWYNYTYDDMTDLSSTELLGEARFEITAGMRGKFTVVSRTRCGKKRLLGDDDWDAYIVEDGDPELNKYYITSFNRGDGNYDFLYPAGTNLTNLDKTERLGEGFKCGKYTMYLEYFGQTFDDLREDWMKWPMEIQPAMTNATESYVEEPLTSGPYGVVNKFVLQGMDSYGCNAWEAYDLDRITVMLHGPYNLTAAVTPLGNGRYEAAFVPEAMGTYNVQVLMDGVAIKDGVFCFEALEGASMSFDGTNYVTVPEAADPEALWADTALDMATMGQTMEMWLRPTEKTDSQLLYKGKFNEIEQYNKGYTLQIIQQVLSMDVYAGGGRVRKVSVALNDDLFPLNEWIHIAGVYDGMNATLYINGAEVATSTFADVRPAKRNPYNKELTIGYGFVGDIDDVVLWRVARTEEEIVGTMYCPPAISRGELEHIAAYFTFNEGSGVETHGHGVECDPLAMDCLVGTVTSFNAATAFEFGRVMNGVGIPSAAFSFNPMPPYAGMLAGDTGDTVFHIHARDRCGYKYLKGLNLNFQVMITTSLIGNQLQYLSDDAPAVELPIFGEVGSQTDLPLVNAESVCPGMFSDVYAADLGSVTTAGIYQVHTEVGSQPMQQGDERVEVMPNNATNFTLSDIAGNEAPTMAGVPRAVHVYQLDQYGNIVHDETPFTAVLTLTGRSPLEMVYTIDYEDVTFNPKTYMYTFFFTVGLDGTYTFELKGENAYMQDTVSVSKAPWNKMTPAMAEAPKEATRFEHSSVVYNDDLYIFGGASADKVYLDDVWKYADTAIDQFAYQKTVNVSVTAPDGLEDATVEFTVNTKELVDAGRMRLDCLDLVFAVSNVMGIDWETGPLSYYLDPSPGCYSEATVVFVKVPSLPAGESELVALYGSSQYATNPYIQPEEVFAFYDGFESHVRGARGYEPMGKFDLYPPCGEESAPETSFPPAATQELPYAGAGSLYMQWGSPAVLVAKMPEHLSEFKLRAMLWDSNSVNAAHYISPNFGNCSEGLRLPEGYGPLEARSTAVGTYTLANRMHYAVASPWQKSAVARSGHWAQLEITSTLDRTLVVSIDGVPVKTEEGAILMDKVLLSGGYGVDSAPHANLANSHAFWDEVSVLKLVPASALSAAMEADVPLLTSFNRVWTPVVTEGSKPSPRYSHTAVQWEDTMVVFGGERSAHSFGDVWMLNFTTSAWEYVAPQGEASPPARFDHTAVLMGHKMVVYGGRSGKKILSDVWAFDLVERTWALLASQTPMGERFGHAAALRVGSDDEPPQLYVFGGYAPDEGFTNHFFRCSLEGDDWESNCIDIGLTCSSVPPGRYAHTAYADDTFMYVYGGSNLETAGGFNSLHRVNIGPLSGQCAFESINMQGDKPARYEHSMAVAGKRLLIQGGHDSGAPDGTVYTYPIA